MSNSQHRLGMTRRDGFLSGLVELDEFLSSEDIPPSSDHSIYSPRWDSLPVASQSETAESETAESETVEDVLQGWDWVWTARRWGSSFANAKERLGRENPEERFRILCFERAGRGGTIVDEGGFSDTGGVISVGTESRERGLHGTAGEEDDCWERGISSRGMMLDGIKEHCVGVKRSKSYEGNMSCEGNKICERMISTKRHVGDCDLVKGSKSCEGSKNREGNTGCELGKNCERMTSTKRHVEDCEGIKWNTSSDANNEGEKSTDEFRKLCFDDARFSEGNKTCVGSCDPCKSSSDGKFRTHADERVNQTKDLHTGSSHYARLKAATSKRCHPNAVAATTTTSLQNLLPDAFASALDNAPAIHRLRRRVKHTLSQGATQTTAAPASALKWSVFMNETEDDNIALQDLKFGDPQLSKRMKLFPTANLREWIGTRVGSQCRALNLKQDSRIGKSDCRACGNMTKNESKQVFTTEIIKVFEKLTGLTNILFNPREDYIDVVVHVDGISARQAVFGALLKACDEPNRAYCHTRELVIGPLIGRVMCSWKSHVLDQFVVLDVKIAAASNAWVWLVSRYFTQLTEECCFDDEEVGIDRLSKCSFCRGFRVFYCATLEISSASSVTDPATEWKRIIEELS